MAPTLTPVNGYVVAVAAREPIAFSPDSEASALELARACVESGLPATVYTSRLGTLTTDGQPYEPLTITDALNIGRLTQAICDGAKIDVLLNEDDDEPQTLILRGFGDSRGDLLNGHINVTQAGGIAATYTVPFRTLLAAANAARLAIN